MAAEKINIKGGPDWPKLVEVLRDCQPILFVTDKYGLMVFDKYEITFNPSVNANAVSLKGRIRGEVEAFGCYSPKSQTGWMSLGFDPG